MDKNRERKKGVDPPDHPRATELSLDQHPIIHTTALASSRT